MVVVGGRGDTWQLPWGGGWGCEGLPGGDSFIKSGHALGPDVCPDLMNEVGSFWPLVWNKGGDGERGFLGADVSGTWVGFGQAC